jgi:hypothetical protein
MSPLVPGAMPLIMMAAAPPAFSHRRLWTAPGWIGLPPTGTGDKEICIDGGISDVV